jgi:hypothetical protein
MVIMQTASYQRGRAAIFFGSGAGVAIILLLVSQGLTSSRDTSVTTETVVSTSTETMVSTQTQTSITGVNSVTTQTSSTSILGSEAAVITAFDNHLLNIETANSTGLTDGYTKNIGLAVQTNLPQNDSPIDIGFLHSISGHYVGTNASLVVKAFIAGIFDQYNNMTMAVLNLEIANPSNSTIGSNNTVTNSTIYLAGFGTAGQARATIIMQEQYILSGGDWLISEETWTIVYYMDNLQVFA